MAEYAIGAATAGVKILAQWVGARAMEEINLGWGFKTELPKLHKKFEYIQAFLDDASNTKYANKSKQVNLWVQQVKDAAYSADDVMDEYAIEIFRRKMEPKHPMEEFGNWFTPSSPAIFHLQMAHKVKEVLSLFDEIDKEAKNIGLNQVNMASSPSVGQSNNDVPLSTIAVKASEFMEREDDQDKLLDVICNPGNYEEPRLTTVAIVGMGGVGKTTLTRYLYDHERTRAHFGNNKIWICVSQNFEFTGLLNEMIESVTTIKSMLSNMDAILRKLEQELKGKKLLLVFDDVWNDKPDSWRCLEGWLNKIGTLPGSVMLINTRGHEVAKAAGAVFKHKLEGLSADKSWSLLQKLVFNNNNQPINPSMEEVGRRIVAKCKGVPLAIKEIGGLLQSKCDLDEWGSIEKSQIWDTHGRRLILPTLFPSFNHLPSPSIKQCFAYCAVIPRGNYLFKSELISLWSSQGYLRDDTRKNMTAEEIGEENLNILLSNSLLKCVQTNYGILGYLMHELVYDLAVYVCGSDLIKIKEAKDLHEIGNCRHLVFESCENGSEIAFPPEKALTKLRTLSLKGIDIPWDFLIHSRYLRTLKLDRTGITELPPAVMMLKHLRFLDVSYNPISTLPDSIAQLHQLQTLILKGCRNMKKLPKVLYNLVNLRHVLTTSPMLAWRGLQQLTNLQNLASLSLDNDEDRWMRDDYEDLHQLGDTIQSVKDDIKASKVTELNFLWVKQIRETDEGISDEDELEALEPYPNITSLEVQNFTCARFPKWITVMAVLTGVKASRTQLNNLITIKLLNCNRCQTLPKLGQLPHLKCLVLSEFYVEIIGIEFYGGDDLAMPEVVSFNSLQELEVSGFRRLGTWREAPKAAFPSLETLRIKGCTLLESLPVSEFKSLMTLELENLNSVESIDIIKYSLGLVSLTMDGLPKIASLPPELANCTKLQTLHISNFQKLASLPSGLESLIYLQSLRVTNGAAMNFVINDLLHIRNFLRTYQIVDCPSLRVIQNLPSLLLDDDDDGWTRDDFADLHQLRDEVYVLALECKLNFLWVKETRETSEAICDEDDLEVLEPYPNITSLEVQNFTCARFPKWITVMAVLTGVKASRTQLNNLITIKLLNCNRCQTLPKLGQLPHLKCLVLSEFYVEIIGIEFYGGDDLAMPEVVSFNSLQELEVSGFRRLGTWREAPKAAFPSLETLRIKGCILLESLPVSEFKSLTTLELENLINVESIDIIKNSLGLLSLTLDMLPKIASLPQELANCTKLQTLHISNCQNLASLPSGFESLIYLQSLRVTNGAAMNFVLDDVVHIRTFLRTFQSVDCPNLRTIQNLPSLLLEDDEDRWTRDNCGDLHQLGDEVYVLALECAKANFFWENDIGEITKAIWDEDDLEAQEPPPSITSLEVKSFSGERFPKWIMDMAVLTGMKDSWTQLNNLHTVKLFNCSKCKTLPKLGQLPLLKFLTLRGLDVESIGSNFYGGNDLGPISWHAKIFGMPVSFKCLRELEISGFHRLTTWTEPPEAAFPSLETLRIKDCFQLETVPELKFKSLTNLELSHLYSLESVNIIKYNSGLTSIILNMLPKIGSLPQELANCRNLQTLHISDFRKLASLPTGLEALVNLQSLKVYHCAVLNFIMDDILHIRSSLHKLEINNCPSLGTIPSSLDECTMLKTLMIKTCPMIKGSHTNMSKLKRLCELRMSFRSGEQLRSVLESAKDLPLLKMLEIEGFRDEKEMNDYFSDMTLFLNLPFLNVLMLSGHPNIKTLPQQLGMLTRIGALRIWHFDDLEESPSWICNLTSLRCLTFENCKNLKGLPSKEDMECLTYLRIANCPRLVRRYAKDEGSEWDNISHIREINIDGKTILKMSVLTSQLKKTISNRKRQF